MECLRYLCRAQQSDQHLEQPSDLPIFQIMMVFGRSVAQVVDLDVGQIAELDNDIANVPSLIGETSSVRIRDLDLHSINVVPSYTYQF